MRIFVRVAALAIALYDRARPFLLQAYVNVVSNFLLTVNSSVVFVIYILLDRKFRAICIAFFAALVLLLN